MTDRVVLHVGAPKSGTTYLQAILERNRDAFARAGVLVAGASQLERIHAAFVIREDPRLDALPDEARGAWGRLVTQIREWHGTTAVLSYELLCAAGESQASAALKDLAGLEVHVVVTARDFAAAVPSAWQERLKFALTTPLEEWDPKPESAPRAEWGWRTLDPAGVAQRWGSTLPPQQVHVVTTPRQGRDRTELWSRFATAAGIADVPGIELDVETANESLGAGAAELLRRVNELVGPPLDTNREQARWLRDTLAHQVLAPLDDEPIGVTDEQYESARALSEESIARITAAGYDVVGELDDLRATRRAGRTPGELTSEELLDMAVKAVLGLLLRLRDAHAPPPAVEPTPGLGELGKAAVARMVTRPVRSSIDEANRRIDEIDSQIREGRRLHQRVAMLSDLVAELLLPLGDQQVEVTAEALRRYRKENL
jgi:hypothetical protein